MRRDGAGSGHAEAGRLIVVGVAAVVRLRRVVAEAGGERAVAVHRGLKGYELRAGRRVAAIAVPGDVLVRDIDGAVDGGARVARECAADAAGVLGDVARVVAVAEDGDAQKRLRAWVEAHPGDRGRADVQRRVRIAAEVHVGVVGGAARAAGEIDRHVAAGDGAAIAAQRATVEDVEAAGELKRAAARTRPVLV